MNVKLIIPEEPGYNMVREYGTAIAGIAGGFTATRATGVRANDEGYLCVEPVVVFDCYVDDDYLAATASAGWNSCNPVKLFRDLARRIADDLNQDCVYVEIDHKCEFVKGTE